MFNLIYHFVLCNDMLQKSRKKGHNKHIENMSL